MGVGGEGGALVWISLPSTLVFPQSPRDTGGWGSPLGPTTPHPILWFLLHCLGLKGAPAHLGGPKALKDPGVLLRRAEFLSYRAPCLCISGDILGTPLHCRGSSDCGQWSSLSKMPCRDRPVNGSGLCSFIQEPDPQTVPNTRILHPPEHSTAGIDRFFFSIRKKIKAHLSFLQFLF